MGCPEQVPAPYIEIAYRLSIRDFKCHFCKQKKPAGSIGVEYLRNGTLIMIACIWHKMCRNFEETGMLCKNHGEAMDVECNEIPF